MNHLIDQLNKFYARDENGLFISTQQGYWSNLSFEENKILIGELKNNSAKQALLKCQPWLEEVIYSPKRQAGLELLQLSGNEICIDYGCMWGALTIPLAKRTQFVLGIDQTKESLIFLKARAKEENLDNIALLCADLKSLNKFQNIADVAIVNGVLEWIPEIGQIELKSYYGKYLKRDYERDPFLEQKRFLQSVQEHLKENGKLYLAIENRYDFKMFFSVKDHHANLLFTSFLPRKIASLISMVKLGRPYVNWLYSFNAIRLLLIDSGFSKVDLYMCFPDYRFPERIIPYESSLNNFKPTISSRNTKGKRTLKRALARSFEYVIFKILKAKYCSPSIIAIGHK